MSDYAFLRSRSNQVEAEVRALPRSTDEKTSVRMPRGPTILVIDDEPASRHALRKILMGADYQFFDASTGAQALERMSAHNCDMIVMDLALSDMDGLDLIRTIRHQSLMPIIVLSMRDDERLKVRALDLGADDYVTKPFADGELLARMRTAFRHRFQAKGEEPKFVSGDLVVDLVRREVRVCGQPVSLTPLEYQVLSLLVRYAGRVLTHPQMTAEIWGKSKPASLQPLRVIDRKSTRLNSSHRSLSRMPSSA